MGILIDAMACRDTDARAAYPKGLVLVAYDAAVGKTRPVDGPFEPSAEMPAVAIIRTRYSFGEGMHAVLVEPDDDGGWRAVRGRGVGPMFGGRFIWTSDSRFGEAVGAGPFGQPVKLHDRYETREEYATYD